MIEAFVPGVPKPQGSMSLVNRRTGKMRHSQSLIDWRAACIMVIRSKAKGERFPTGPVELTVTFCFARPASHTAKIAKADGNWKPRGSDLDKLVRAVCDACTYAGVITDDTQIAAIQASKVYMKPEGALIWLRSLASEPASSRVPAETDRP